MRAEWKGILLTEREITLALDMARGEIEGEVRTALSPEETEKTLISLAGRGFIQMTEEGARLESMLAFVLRHYLAREGWMRLYDRHGEIRVARTATFWTAIGRNGRQWQVTPLETETDALEEAMNFARRARGHCFVQTGWKAEARKAVRVGENWEIRIPAMWDEAMLEEEEQHGEHDSGDTDSRGE